MGMSCRTPPPFLGGFRLGAPLKPPNKGSSHDRTHFAREDTGLYKALVKSQDIEEELTKIRNLIRKRGSKVKVGRD